jgi:acyl-coenzyme A synthetase/AMP-(fatty) acid ligase
MLYRGYRISYGEFAFWIADARRFFAAEKLRPGSIAVFVTVPLRLDAWVLDFALRSLGIDTLAVAFPEFLADLDLRNVSCVITTLSGVQIHGLPVGSYKLVRVPQPLYLGRTTGSLPEMPDLNQPEGGHILLTSGTSGVRKKVLASAHDLAAICARRAAIYELDRKSLVNVLDCAMWTGAGYKFPLSTWSKGGGVIFHQGQDPHQSLLIEGITHAEIPPARLADILKGPDSELRFNPGLLLSVGGAPMTRQLAEAARTKLTPQVYSCLASTEVGIWGFTRINRPNDLASHQIHPTVEVQVVDGADRPLAADQMGAIRVRPVDGVSGYFEDAAATSQFFRDGYFYPGDIGEFRADGRLIVHGRASSVIILRGTKIAAEPIERKLQECLGVESACVLSFPGEGTEDDVHLVVQSRQPLPEAELASAIKSELDGFPPIGIHFVPDMPRNDMGKIDRIMLRRRVLTMSASLII